MKTPVFRQDASAAKRKTGDMKRNKLDDVA
jgi:hypothetical protein